MVAAAERLKRALAAAAELAPALEGRRQPDEATAVQVVPWAYEPWWAQRMFLRPEAPELVRGERGGVTIAYVDGRPTRMIVAGRQSGKTECACRAVLNVMGTEPGSYSLLLAPVYKNAQATIDKLRAIMRECGLEALGWQWKEQAKRLVAPNGSILAVFSADKDDSVRGPTITGVLWFDEAAMLSNRAREVASAALIASKDPRTLITTTPMGLNWVHRLWVDASPEAAQRMTRVRFRSLDSPHANRVAIEEERRKMSHDMAQQEFDAVFVATLFLVFPAETRERMWVTELPKRDPRTAKNVLGIDLGKEQDFCVVTLGNKFNEFVPLGRWQHVAWPETVKRLVSYAKHYQAVCVVDDGAGGGYGSVVAGYLTAEDIRVVRFQTASRGKKAAMVESARAAAEHYALKLLRPDGDLGAVYEDELAKFQGKLRVVQGQRINVYEGPQIEGEHDDCPISLCLAHWGSKNAWEGVWESTVNVGDFLDQPGLSPGFGDVEAHDLGDAESSFYTF